MEKLVRCNGCMGIFDESELKYVDIGIELVKGCPVCETDAYLMNLDEED